MVQHAKFENIPVINCLRGIAASMVCFFHFVAVKTDYIESDTIKDFFSYGRNGVHIFFVISGVVIPLSMIRSAYTWEDWRSFMLKRLIRLEPPYLFSLLLVIVYFQVRTLVPGTADLNLMPSARDLFLHIGYLIPFVDGNWALPIYWTLGVEFQYYIVLSLLLPIVLKDNHYSRRGLFYMLFLIMPFIFPGRSFFPIYAPLFLLGILYAFLITNIIRINEYGILMAICIIVSLIVLPLSETIAGLFAILIIHYLPMYTNKALGFLGEISYSLYLLHLITGGALINLLAHKFNESYEKPIVIFIGYLMSVFFAYIFYRIIESPSRRWSKRIVYTRRAMSPSA